jgi:filamentous hemagglutinin family protein
MARTTRALQSVQAMQTAARAAAITGPSHLGMNPNMPAVQLPNVPNGIVAGGLVPDSGLPAAGTKPGSFVMPPSWRGVGELSQASDGSPGGTTTVNVKQTSQQAILNWNKFNIGKQTKLNFDQSAGDANAGQWIAFNKISDPSGVPSQILGSITAQGQVYVINQNGIIFGGSSQVNARALVASSLPINDNLVKQGLLNNRDAQFLFSGLDVPGGADDTPNFTPGPPPAANGRFGDVTVQAGAKLSSPASGDGNGGRVMLVGANVHNAGTISTPSGQTILAAGLQVGVAAHASDDPSLRGLDVWVGDVGDYAGTSTNSGQIEAATGSAWMAGRTVNQRGVIDSSTSVNLNGRIDLRASYGAVGNPNFDNSGAGFGGPQFFNQHTGVVALGADSVTRILPDYLSSRSVPGTALPEKSQINVEGLAVHFGQGAMMLAPNADVAIRAGVWPYKDTNGDRTTLGDTGPVLQNFYSTGSQRFLFSAGQIYLDPLVLLSVAGSVDVAVPLAQSILEVEFRGSELADSPLQRTSSLRGATLTLDIRQTGVTDGRYWVGTPLGDATGLVGLIERNAAQLTAAGGTVTLQAGESIVVQKGAVIDVSGGFYQHEGGMVQTSRLLRGGNLIEIRNALSTQSYDGVYTGTFSVNHSRWGVTETYAVPWMTGRRYQESYIEGASGGVLRMTAPSMAIDGELRGLTVQGPRQRDVLPDYSRLAITFETEKIFEIPGGRNLSFLTFSPTPPEITFLPGTAQTPVEAFQLVNGVPVALPPGRLASVILSPELLEDNFGELSVRNPDGGITLPAGNNLAAPVRGSISLTGSSVTILGTVSAPGGTLDFRTFNISPIFASEFPLLNPIGAPVPPANVGRGLFTLGAGASLRTAGLIVDDRPGSPSALAAPLVLQGGSITIESYSADLAAGSAIDVSGGVAVSGRNVVTYGNGGGISILTGRDPGFTTVIGGALSLRSTLAGYSGVTGGSLTLRASLIQVGGVPAVANTLSLQPEFFRQGGFTNYSLIGIGAATGNLEQPVPGVIIAPGTRVKPVPETWLAIPYPVGSRVVGLRPMLAPVGLRTPASVSFSALGSDDQFTTGVIDVRGDVLMGRGAQIVTDPKATVSFKGQTVSLLGSVSAPGGTISVAGSGSFPLGPDTEVNATFARPTVFLGPEAGLSAAGTAVFVPDAYGRRRGTLLQGGTISVSGNIVASAGAVLDVSGASAVFDLEPAVLGIVGSPVVPLNSGLTAPLWKLRTIPTSVDSSGGLIDLQGSQMLFTDATLLGHAGGATATGGTLSIFSGRFYRSETGRKSSDINLAVTQSGRTIAPTNTNPGIGTAVMDPSGAIISGMGFFTADGIAQGGFASVDMGFKFLNAAPVSFGGNIDFQGPVSIAVPGSLRVAAGGVIRADAAVTLAGSYVAIGQPFIAPLHPDDDVPPFQQDPVAPDRAFALAPVFGDGSLTVKAKLIDIGNLSLQNIGRAAFIADGGDIRGNGTLNIAGDLTLRAAQIYPPTLSAFNIFAYDHGGIPGSVTITGSGSQETPLSAGGSLSVFASKISQGGVLRAPLGFIRLGWDGSDFDPSDADVDQPFDPVARGAVPVPVTAEVSLNAGSITSVSALGAATGAGMLIPFGLSPDGSSWIDPRGVNVTISGLPEKGISVAGTSAIAEQGSVIDLRGGGDLSAFRWVPGTGGSIDLLGTAAVGWSANTEFEPGDLVTSGGNTWSARVRHSGQTPSSSLYWTLVAESFAVIPDFQSDSAPYAAFNTGANSLSLGGEPGYTSNTLQVGDRVYLDGVSGLAAGTYTLLPRRYALLPGAFLVTPRSTSPIGTVTLPDGASYISGFRFNQFSQPAHYSAVRTQFEVAPANVVAGRAAYDTYLGNGFFTAAAAQFDVAQPQRLPIDSGYLAIQGSITLRADGGVLAGHPLGGRGSSIDLGSLADIHIIGGSGTAPAGATAILNTAALNSWGAESLFIGGIRRNGPNGKVVEVRTGNLIVNNAGETLSAPEITLASNASLTVTGGSGVVSEGLLSSAADKLILSGSGTLVRVSSDPGAALLRSNVTDSPAAVLTIGAGARFAGTSVTLDSTFGSAFDPGAVIDAGSLTLGSGQISVVLSAPAAGLAGSVVNPHLTLAGQLLQDVQAVNALTLRSYRTIDFYGSGSFGSATLGSLSLLAGGMRGYDQGAGTVLIEAGDVLMSNPSNVAALAAPAGLSGTLQVDANTIRLGANTFSTTGYANVILNSAAGVLGEGAGSFTTPGILAVTAPVIAGAQGSTHAVTAGGALTLGNTGGVVGVQAGLGAGFTFTGTSVLVDTNVLLPSGQLTLRATTGDVTVGGRLDVAGTMQAFYDLIRYSDAGSITLTADAGNVRLLAGSTVSVAAAVGGNAGSIAVNASQGAFNLVGDTLLGGASAGKTSGSFTLDAGMLPSFTALSSALNSGGFFEQRNLRVRTGDIVIADAAGQGNVARHFNLSTDQGSIRVTGTIDASGDTGGTIVLVAGGSLVLEPTARLTAHAAEFSRAGKGGEIRLEAGAAVNGVANVGAILDLKAGSSIDLGVDEFLPGSFSTPGSSAFLGQFTGTLHLRAPRSGNDVQINPLLGNISGASSVLVEGYRIYNQGGGVLDNTLRTAIHNDATAYINAGYAAMSAKLLTGNPNAAALDPILVIAPGVEIINAAGNLSLGTPNNPATGFATSLSTADWDLSGFRYGPRNAPGVLTLRAAGDLIFNNSLSDGFTPVAATSANGHSRLWLGTLQTINAALPVNTQSWSYRLAAGSDLAAADFRTVVANAGSLLVGEFYIPVPNGSSSGNSVATGASGLTANTIRISTTETDRGTRYEVIRTGTGDIEIAAGRDVQLRNQFATIYTAGVALPVPTTIFAPNDFVAPLVNLTGSSQPANNNGAIQQQYSPQWSLAGGDVTISAGADIWRTTLRQGVVIADSTGQLPVNWLYRRGYVDPTTGLFGIGGVNSGDPPLVDPSASTTWWVDFSNFFQGIGALGGGDVSLLAGSDLINTDAVIPTNARMPGLDSVSGLNVAPDATKLVELGGGDLIVRAGQNIDGGIYYTERGDGTLFAGGVITTNQSRSPSRGILSATPQILDPVTWLPTTLFLGKGGFDVSARGDILLGPVANPFLLPSGLNNRYWYKTNFNTYSPDSELNVASFGGSVTHRLGTATTPILNNWLGLKNLFTSQNLTNSSNFQPWIRLAETAVSPFSTLTGVLPPTVRSTAFAGDVNIAGRASLFPSPTGTLELAASGGIIGLQPTGKSGTITTWTAASINVSDADPASVPGIASPFAYVSVVGRTPINLRVTNPTFLSSINQIFTETGSFTGLQGTIRIQQSLHASSLLHAGDPDPVRIYAGGRDITGLTLFSPKATRIIADNDITDVSFYVQNVAPSDISLVSAGRDIVPYGENAPLRSLASDASLGNAISDPQRGTVIGVNTNALPGDIQINGPGLLEVIAGRNLDLGTGPNYSDGTGVGLTSIGNARNPFLPQQGADLIALAGVPGFGGSGAALGLRNSSLDWASFITEFDVSGKIGISSYLPKLGFTGAFTALTEEQQAIVALEIFYRELRDAGRNSAETGSYAPGVAAVDTLFGTTSRTGEILSRARDIRTSTGGAISLIARGGGLTMASDIFGNPLTPPGIVTEFGGAISIFTDQDVDIGQARIFTLRGGDIVIWSSKGNIAAGNAPRTVVTAPPTRVLIDVTSGSVQTDLGGLATGGGIGVLASVEGVMPGNVDLIAPLGFVDAGDAGIRSTGNLNIAATAVLNASNIQVSGSTSGVSSGPSVAAPNIGGLTSASNQGAAQSSGATDVNRERQRTDQPVAKEEPVSIISIEILGYGGGDGTTEEAEERKKKRNQQEASAAP